MAVLNPEALAKYKEAYQKDPNSKVFAPLAEAYRKNKQLEHAFDIAQKGVKLHPDFASGRVTLARIMMDQKTWDLAITELKQAAELNPEILLAHKLLGECYLQIRNPTLALQAFKMTLYLDPMDVTAKMMVKKLESLSAQDFAEEDILDTPKSNPATSNTSASLFPKSKTYEIDRYTSLADAFIARQDFNRALECLDEAMSKLGKEPQFLRRKKYVEKRFQENSSLAAIKDHENLTRKIDKLQKILNQINERQIFPEKPLV